jgi:hypothetical protein
MEAMLTQSKKSFEIIPIRHSIPGFQLYTLETKKSSPQISGDEFTGNAFDNLNYLKKSLLNYRISNTIEEKEIKCKGIDQTQKPTNFNKSTYYTFGCINNNELNGPGSGIRIRYGRQPQLIYIHNDAAFYRSSSQKLADFAGFYKRGMVLVKIRKQGDFPGNLLMDPAAQGLFFVLCHIIQKIFSHKVTQIVKY